MQGRRFPAGQQARTLPLWTKSGPGHGAERPIPSHTFVEPPGQGRISPCHDQGPRRRALSKGQGWAVLLCPMAQRSAQRREPGAAASQRSLVVLVHPKAKGRGGLRAGSLSGGPASRLSSGQRGVVRKPGASDRRGLKVRRGAWSAWPDGRREEPKGGVSRLLGAGWRGPLVPGRGDGADAPCGAPVCADPELDRNCCGRAEPDFLSGLQHGLIAAAFPRLGAWNMTCANNHRGR